MSLNLITMTHSKNRCKKDLIIDWSATSEFSKALQFVSFHKVQNKHKEVALHAISSNLNSPYKGL